MTLWIVWEEINGATAVIEAETKGKAKSKFFRENKPFAGSETEPPEGHVDFIDIYALRARYEVEILNFGIWDYKEIFPDFDSADKYARHMTDADEVQENHTYYINNGEIVARVKRLK